MINAQKYAGKKAVVTGGTHGIGLATVKMLVAGGAEVLLTGRNPANLAAVQEELGSAVHVVASDAGSMTDIQALGGIVEKALGKIDLLFINVGTSTLTPFDVVTVATYDDMFNINTRGSYFTVQQLAPLVNRGGAIVFTTSVANGSGIPGMGVYAGTKAALRSFTKSFAAELLPLAIRVNAVSPGFTDTPSMGVTGVSEEEKAAFRQVGDIVTPMKRHGSVEEVAKAVLFLAFDATFTTGEELMVDGGLGQQLTPPGEWGG